MIVADGYVIADGILVVPPNAAPSTATWTFTAAETGEYQLAANWTAHPNLASNATYTLMTTAGSQTVVMDKIPENTGTHTFQPTQAFRRLEVFKLALFKRLLIGNEFREPVFDKRIEKNSLNLLH